MSTPTSPAAPPASASDEAIARQNVTEARLAHDGSAYYAAAEPSMEGQWRGAIWPLIKDADFTATLDLAAGHGRNSAKLIEHARDLWIVDVNQSCVDACRDRFGAYTGPCRLHFHVNDGTSLAFIPDASLTLVYTWDAMVHFDKRVIQKYVHEFARVMRPGARAFVHHSNYGAFAPDPESRWRDNPAWRSTMTAELMREYCAEAGLRVDAQRLMDWGGVKELDCVSLLSKPGPGDADATAAPPAGLTDGDRLRTNLRETRLSWETAPYYDQAEAAMDGQWRHTIWPLIVGSDFSTTLDLAAGHGRNSDRLKDLARELWIVDINQSCTDACRARFRAYAGPCRMHFHVNDGASLPFIPDGSLSFVYSWDAAVHFDKRVIERYVHEFARIMKPGARGFLHHSNYGAFAPDPESNWKDNPSWRSTMSAALMREYCAAAGLRVESQRVMGWGGVDGLDCLTVFSKPHAGGVPNPPPNGAS